MHIVCDKRLVWADNMFYVPERLVDSDVVGCAAEKETGVGSLGSDFIGDRPTLVYAEMYKDCCYVK